MPSDTIKGGRKFKLEKALICKRKGASQQQFDNTGGNPQQIS